MASFNALIAACPWPTALRLLSEASAWSVKPTVVSYNATMESLKRGFEWHFGSQMVIKCHYNIYIYRKRMVTVIIIYLYPGV